MNLTLSMMKSPKGKKTFYDPGTIKSTMKEQFYKCLKVTSKLLRINEIINSVFCNFHYLKAGLLTYKNSVFYG
jgi:hypothetical protein